MGVSEQCQGNHRSVKCFCSASLKELMDNEGSGSVWGSRKKQEMRSCLALGGRLFGRLGQAKEKSQLKSLNCSKMCDLRHLSLPEESRNAQTVFRDKSGRKRNLAQEQLEQRLKAEAEAKREEQYAKWGKG